MNARTTLSKISQDRWRWIIQGQIEGRERDIISGIHAAERRGLARGISQGERRKAIETARILKQSNISLDVIAKSTGLSVEEILSL